MYIRGYNKGDAAIKEGRKAHTDSSSSDRRERERKRALAYKQRAAKKQFSQVKADLFVGPSTL